MKLLADGPVFARFVRDHPRARELFVLCMERLPTDLPKYDVMIRPTCPFIEIRRCYEILYIPLQMVIHAGGGFSDGLVPLGPLLAITPILRVQIIDVINDTFRQLDHYPSIRGIPRDHSEWLGLCKRTGESMIDYLTGVQTAQELTCSGVLPYRNCEGQALGPCRTLSAGRAMAKCSKCVSVIYCGTDHQLAHWPTHKKMCFKKRW